MGLRPTQGDENCVVVGNMIVAWKGQGRSHSGFIEAVLEFGLECVL
jgi:hypothetical protein